MSLDTDPRPKWVIDVIHELDEEITTLDRTIYRLSSTAKDLTAGAEINVSQITEAAHEIEHARGHLASLRRAIRMTWPHEPGDTT